VNRNPFEEEEEEEEEERQRDGSMALAPKVKIVDGKVVVDQESLTVTTGAPLFESCTCRESRHAPTFDLTVVKTH